MFPVSPPRAGLPRDYAETLSAIKQRIQQERIRVVLAANSAMVLLYWDIGRMILDRQQHQGWGAKVIDRLAADLREAFPDMKGFSPRNLKYMRAFAAAWPDLAIVQQLAAQIPWFHNCLFDLGSGFAFVGRQIHLEFTSCACYLDLLFYHLKLRTRRDPDPLAVPCLHVR